MGEHWNLGSGMQDIMSWEGDAGTKQVMCVSAFWVTEQSLLHSWKPWCCTLLLFPALTVTYLSDFPARKDMLLFPIDCLHFLAATHF